MYNQHKPYLFINLRKHVDTAIIYAIFNQTYRAEQGDVLIYSIDHEHENITCDILLRETIKASFHECYDTIKTLKEIYEVPNAIIDGLCGEIKPVPYLPFKAGGM